MTFPDVEAMVRAFLLERVDVPVSTRVPKNRPATFVHVRRNGGTAVSRVQDNPTVTVDAWAATEIAAFELASTCREAFLHEYTDMPLVRGVSESGAFYAVPDPESGSPRYRFTVTLNVRASRR